MKNSASIHTSAYLTSTLPMTAPWGESSHRITRPRFPRLPRRFALDTDEFAASKQEVVAGGILALCFLYTLGHVFAQFAF